MTIIKLEYRNLFDEPALSIDEYLEGVDKKFILQAMILLSNGWGEYQDDIYTFLIKFFSTPNQILAQQLYSRIFKMGEEIYFKTKVIPKYTIINVQSSLAFFYYVFQKEDTPNLLPSKLSNAEAEIRIFKAYLLFNEQLNYDDVTINSTSELSDKVFKGSSMFFTNSFSYFEYTNFDINKISITQAIKAVKLFSFMEEFNGNTKSLLAQLLKEFNCVNWQEYVQRLFPLMMVVSKMEKGEYPTIQVTNDENYEAMCIFLDKLSLVKNEEPNTDFIHLRSNPLYKEEEGSYRIIYHLFALEKIFKGLAFAFNEINNRTKTIKNWLSFYKEEFSEKYLFCSILDFIYSKRSYIKFSEQQGKGELLKLKYSTNIVETMGVPDYYIRNGKKILLFESKDILIDKGIKQSSDYSQYEKEFTKKLRNKGISQLINSIEKILKKELYFDTNYKVDNVEIYPILVLHHHQFNTMGLNAILNEWFLEDIALRLKDYNISKVRNLVLIDIDTLLYHEDLFQNKWLDLYDLINEYHNKHTVFNPKKAQINGNEHEYMKTIQSFSEFVDNKANKISNNKKLGTISVQKIQKLCVSIFPTKN